MEWNGLATGLTSIITTLTIIGGALIWIYKKLVSDPDKRMAKEIQKENTQSLRESVEPLTRSIELLNQILERSSEDTQKLTFKVDKHDEELNEHDKRITVLEDRKERVK